MGSSIDLLEVEVICRNILTEDGALQWTGRELREKIATALKVDLEALSEKSVKEQIDNIALEILSKQADIVTSDKKTPNKSSKKPKTVKESPVQKAKVNKGKSVKESKIDSLKSYIVKCGVRKVWKRELDGLNDKQSIAKLEGILGELGMEGRPTLEKCKSIKERREYQEELKALEDNAVLTTRLRKTKDTKKIKVESKSESDDDGLVNVKKTTRLNLSLFGDAEDSE